MILRSCCGDSRGVTTCNRGCGGGGGGGGVIGGGSLDGFQYSLVIWNNAKEAFFVEQIVGKDDKEKGKDNGSINVTSSHPRHGKY